MRRPTGAIPAQRLFRVVAPFVRAPVLGVLTLLVLAVVPIALAAGDATAVPASSSSGSTTALGKLRALVIERPRSYTSVAVFDFRTNTLTKMGAGSGMICASIAKVQLLESLLLKRQRAGRQLSRHERALVTPMIEHSDNAAADAVYATIGGSSAVRALEPRLGLNVAVHHLGDDGRWGLTTTSAGQEVVLLRNLVSTRSALSSANKRYAISLMRHVESDQRWGVPVVADKGTQPAVKNGWLGVIRDNGRWAVNSIGLATVQTHLLAIAVLTRYDRSYLGGIARVQSLVRAASRAALA